MDGTKIRASANKGKSRTYAHLLKSKEELQEEIRQITQEAEEVDKAEDQKYGKGNRGDELPKELESHKKRKSTIERLLSEIKEEAEQKKKEYPQKKAEMKAEDDEWMKESGLKFERRPPVNPTGKAVEKIVKSRRNSTS